MDRSPVASTPDTVYGSEGWGLPLVSEKGRKWGVTYAIAMSGKECYQTSAAPSGRDPCQPRARTGRKPETLTSTKTTTKPALTSIAAVEPRPEIDMVRRRSTVRFRNGAPASSPDG